MFLFQTLIFKFSSIRGHGVEITPVNEDGMGAVLDLKSKGGSKLESALDKLGFQKRKVCTKVAHPYFANLNAFVLALRCSGR